MRPIDADKVIANLTAMRDRMGYNAISLDGMIKGLEDAPTFEPPNPPLTLEELREMEGEPVWVEWLESPNLSCWAIRHSEFADGYYSVFFDVDYRKEWLAYRRKTEEG